MSDIYVPGVKSRFNTDQMIDDLMKLERIPRDRTQSNIDTLQTQKSYWQEIGRRITSLRDSSRMLYSFQNPFNERMGQSSDESVITAIATREASEQQFKFTVKQTAQADRFLSRPLDEKTRIEAGTYTFNVGNDEISINYRGGTLRNFVETVNNRGRDKIAASLIAVQLGTLSLMIESKLTGSANRLGFSGDASDLAINFGMVERSNDTLKTIDVSENAVNKSGLNAVNVTVNDGILKAAALSTISVPINMQISSDSPLVLRLHTQTKTGTDEMINIPKPPPGPSVPISSVTYGGITVENAPSQAPMPEHTVPEIPARHDDMAVLNLIFTDGSNQKLPAISDSSSPVARQYNLAEIARGRTIASLNIENTNTHREVSVGKIEILDPTTSTGGLKPINAVSTSRDAIIAMEGIEITRPTNNIDDLVPGVTLNVRGVSDKPVELKITGNTEAVKEAIISFVGNYNRLMAEINILISSRGNVTPDLKAPAIRGDERIVDELTYLSRDEAEEMKKRLGAFAGDSTLNTLKSNLQRTITAPYPTSLERDLTLLAQIGVSSNAARNAGYDPSRLRGYLEIDEKVLDSALETKIPAIKELFGSDTTGDMIADTGVAFNVDTLVRPFVELGGIISLKTGTIDSRINQDERRIATLDRQLAAKEQDLRIQYARMESAYSRMEQLSNSLDSFSQQNRGGR
ncbi:MAG: flagellar filament capping protein FliD [Treponema sp.]|nr:flagellar filament capping protein FliD [Treponema sp.]